MADQWEKTVRCEDALGRPRSVRIFPSDANKAVVQAPARESCVLTLEQLGELQAKLYDLSIELYRRSAQP